MPSQAGMQRVKSAKATKLRVPDPDNVRIVLQCEDEPSRMVGAEGTLLH
jgi:hypothetical protein